MLRIKSRKWAALATYVGTILGAGIFGVPYVMSRAGIGVGVLYVVILGLVMMCVDLWYAEVVLAIREHHRYPGFAGALLGRYGKVSAAVIGIVGGWFMITIYIILGGRFLGLVLEPIFGGTEVLYQFGMAIMGALVVLGGIGFVARAEFALAGFEVAVVVFIAMASAWHLRGIDLFTLSSAALFLPYGVILFSLTGSSAIPELEDVVGNGARNELRWVIKIGMLIVMAVTAIFGATIAGLTGAATSPDAISGLVSVVGPWIAVVGALGGFLLIITSLFTSLMNQMEIFMFDYRIPRLIAWIAALGIPLGLFLIGARDFISMLGITGGVLAGLGGVLSVFMYGALLRKRGVQEWWRFALPGLVIVLFFLGAYTELSSFF